MADYPLIPGTERIPDPGPLYDASDDALASIPALTSPRPPQRGGKHIFAFWHSGIASLPPYLRRNVLSWHRRFGPLGWSIYVLDAVEGSPLHLSRFIDASSPAVVPAALIDGSLGGGYASQHTSDLVRYPLLLRYGGVYLDVGVLQFGDLDWLWTTHLGNPDSPYDFAGFTMGDPPEHVSIVNFALAAVADSPLVLRAHKILLKLWEGRTSTTGTHSHPLVAHVPLLRVPPSVTASSGGDNDLSDGSMTDYAIQIQAMGAAQRWRDEGDGWDGPAYVRERCWLYSMLDMAYVSEGLTGWDGRRQHELFALGMPGDGEEEETADQRLAREIVERSIAQSWCLKLAHGFSAELFGGPTLGMRWREDVGSDCRPGTYGGWLRWAMSNLRSPPPPPLKITTYEPTMVGSLNDML